MMEEYMIRAGLVNGNIVNDLLKLCNESFTEPGFFTLKSSGGVYFCIFCSAYSTNNKKIDHSTNCPVVKYQDLAAEHERYIVEKRKR
jgi:hypothetical protein